MIEVRNPRTGEFDYSFEAPSDAEIRALAVSLRQGQGSWESAGLDARIFAMSAWRDAMLARRDEIVAALVWDTGRVAESHLEIDAIARSIERWCGLAPSLASDEPPRASSMPGVAVAQGLRPYPLVGVVSPWNFPLLLSLIDAIPALLSGCAVMIKPSEIAPRFIEPLMRSVADVPALSNVLTYVAGGPETGRAIVESVDLVCFTGSVPTGRLIAEHAAKRFIPAFLELGGKDAAVVLGSADIERATSAILWGSTANAGQSCLSIERVYVDESVSDEFVSRISERAREVRLAAPEPGDGEIGPIIAAKQIEVIRDHLDEALSKGAIAQTGGALEEIGGGTYLPPTVLTGVDHSMKVMTEETFGPIVPVMPFSSVDEAVSLANDSVFGLSGAVFAGAEDEALGVARRLNAGGISINDAALTALVYDGEKNSFNYSGLGGSRMGPAAIRRFGRKQAYLVRQGAEPDPWWYPQLRG